MRPPLQISEGTWLQNAIILKAWRTVRYDNDNAMTTTTTTITTMTHCPRAAYLSLYLALCTHIFIHLSHNSPSHHIIILTTTIIIITPPSPSSSSPVIRVYLNGGNAKKALPVDVEADDLSEAIKVSPLTHPSLPHSPPFLSLPHPFTLPHTHSSIVHTYYTFSQPSSRWCVTFPRPAECSIHTHTPSLPPPSLLSTPSPTHIHPCIHTSAYTHSHTHPPTDGVRLSPGPHLPPSLLSTPSPTAPPINLSMYAIF